MENAGQDLGDEQAAEGDGARVRKRRRRTAADSEASSQSGSSYDPSDGESCVYLGSWVYRPGVRVECSACMQSIDICNTACKMNGWEWQVQ